MSASTAIAATTMTYDYDANGNLIRGEGKYFEYNDANQLVRVRQSDANGPVLAEYFYDYNGQRVKKIENGVATYYIGKHFEKRVAGENQTNTSYYFANGERVAKMDSAGTMTFFHSDHLGGTNAVTDATGSLVERTKYYPFGEVREGGSEKYSYTGKEKDKQTDWYYYEARYYNPQFKHFTQADTVEPNIYVPQDLNHYAYTRNNPLKYNDPSGHSVREFFRNSWAWAKQIVKKEFIGNEEQRIKEQEPLARDVFNGSKSIAQQPGAVEFSQQDMNNSFTKKATEMSNSNNINNAQVDNADNTAKNICFNSCVSEAYTLKYAKYSVKIVKYAIPGYFYPQLADDISSYMIDRTGLIIGNVSPKVEFVNEVIPYGTIINNIIKAESVQ